MRIKLHPNETYDVFISYSRNDSDVANEVYKALQNEGIKTFLDTENIVGAQDFAWRVATNILSSRIFLCLASDNYYNANWAPDEIAYAKSHKQRESIYVYIIDNSDLPVEYDLATASINRRLMSSTPIVPDLVDDIKLLLNDQKIISENHIQVDNNATSHIDIGIKTQYNRHQRISINQSKYKKLKLAGVCTLIILFLAIGLSRINSLRNKRNIKDDIDIINTDSIPIRTINTDSVLINNENTDSIINIDKTIKNIDNLDSLKEPKEYPCMILKGHSNEINSICYSANGDKIISGSDDNTIKIWDTSSGLCLNTLDGHTSSVKSVCYSHDEKRIVSCAFDNTVRVWDARTGDCLRIIEIGLYTLSCIKLHPLNDKVLVTSGGYKNKLFYLIDVNTGKIILTFDGHDAGINDVCFSKDGSLIFSVSLDKSVRIWDAKTGKCIKTLVAHKYGVEVIAISPNGNIIISESFDGVMCVWNAETGDLLKKYERPNKAYDLSFSPDGKYILRSVAYGTQIIDVTNGDIIKIFKDNHVITSSMYSPDGKMVASAQGFRYGRNILIWSLP